MRVLTGALCALLLALLSAGHVPDVGGSCAGVSKLALPNVKITLAETVEPGGYCRVAATLTPTSDSDIKMELWLPASGWNGKFQAVGNGAFNGTINYAAMMAALRRGYATASTDTGHVGGSASFARCQTIIATITRSLLTSRNTRIAASAPTRCRGIVPPRVWPVYFVRAMSTVSGR